MGTDLILTNAKDLLEHCREVDEYVNRLRLKEVSGPLEIPVDVRSLLDRLSVQNVDLVRSL